MPRRCNATAIQMADRPMLPLFFRYGDPASCSTQGIATTVGTARDAAPIRVPMPVTGSWVGHPACGVTARSVKRQPDAEWRCVRRHHSRGRGRSFPAQEPQHTCNRPDVQTSCYESLVDRSDERLRAEMRDWTGGSAATARRRALGLWEAGRCARKGLDVRGRGKGN